MKKFILAIVIVLTCLTSFSQELSIQFFGHGEYDEALKKAKKEKKSVLLDFTAKWCLPCRQMDEVTFVNTSISDYLNENYISIKVDVSFFDGIDIAEEYSVTEYPTLIILNHKGKEIHNLTGFQSVDQLLAILKKKKR